MQYDIRRVQHKEEYDAVVRLQQTTWGIGKTGATPVHVLVTAQKNGGLVIGAFNPAAEDAPAGLLGFVFGFVGLTPDGTVKHCSHMAGVLPHYQNQNIGYQLKLAQRDMVLSQGIGLITWTFDPLECRNARLNLHKLGATCRTYLRNLYGTMHDELNAGLPSDRFQVVWHLHSQHVQAHVQQTAPRPTLDNLLASGVPIVNPHPPAPDTLDTLPDEQLASHDCVLVQIPLSFQAVKSASLEEAHMWRTHTRTLFEHLFEQGYVASDILLDETRCYYVLQRQKETNP